MEENRFLLIDPRQQEINKTTSNLYVPAMKEMGWEPPLYVLLYNQVRYYEDYGKLKIGYSVASKEALAKQFGVTPAQIEKTFDNLTNKYHLGNWIVSDSKIFRNVKKVWVSNIRQQRGSLEDTIKILDNSSKIGAKLLQRRSKTPTAEEFASLDDPCPKVIESKVNTASQPKVAPQTSRKKSEFNLLIEKLCEILSLDVTKLNWSAVGKWHKVGKESNCTDEDFIKAAEAMRDAAKSNGFTVSLQKVLTNTEYWLRQAEDKKPKRGMIIT